MRKFDLAVAGLVLSVTSVLATAVPATAQTGTVVRPAATRPVLATGSPAGGGSHGVVVSNVTSSTGSVCAKCGKIHHPPASATAGSAVQRVSYPSAAVPMAASSSISSSVSSAGGVSNVLGALNAQRSRQGIGALRYDASLQAVAQRRAQQMASMGLKSHPPGSFAPGTYEGVGWSSSYSPSGVSACFTNDSRMQYAGAAMATGRDGVYFAVVYR
ncbi:hypothetical protein K227x_63310 [Rubripirellula lacrimiformis]|uniref:SCP domain-containing protein n=1 Tax=Rubripirellula lacrimiformis TaxID=1930273 RepID=A0A517NL88_9BACT|nr:CAP domain-containing protein [Rubripirellula lacrimiformis]QDT07902.1 hypothetical protein K227x_63310 [Rubripirellula lacrimiformis]